MIKMPHGYYKGTNIPIRKGKANPNKGKHISEETRNKIKLSLKGYHHSSETKLKISLALKGRASPNKGNHFNQSEEAKKRMSQIAKQRGFGRWSKGQTSPMKGKKHTEETKQKMRENRKKWSIPFGNTSIELALQNKLTELGINFTKHKPILGQPDIFIEPNICVFADGDYWHNLPNSLQRDNFVTTTLEQKGYKVLRFWEHDINNNLDNCIEKIVKEIYILQNINLKT